MDTICGMPGGKEGVQNLVAVFRTPYRHSSATMDELKPF